MLKYNFSLLYFPLVLLVLTIAMYFFSRDSESYLWSIQLINTNPLKIEYFNNIPSFVFVFSFSLLSIYIFKPKHFLSFISIMLFWLAWGLFWEAIQLHESLSIPYLGMLNQYANSGVFDPLDIGATFLGSVSVIVIYYFFNSYSLERKDGSA